MAGLVSLPNACFRDPVRGLDLVLVLFSFLPYLFLIKLAILAVVSGAALNINLLMNLRLAGNLGNLKYFADIGLVGLV